jgi:RNA polymerase I-specific transcription initiation factor RRN6
MQVGGQAGSQLVIVPMVSGTVKSEEGFEPKLDAELYVCGNATRRLGESVELIGG